MHFVIHFWYLWVCSMYEIGITIIIFISFVLALKRELELKIGVFVTIQCTDWTRDSFYD